MIPTIQESLRSLLVTGRYRGYKQAVIALQIIVENEDAIYSVNENIYLEVARRCGCNPKCIERNIRTIIYRIWRINKDRLRAMAGYPLIAPPTVSEFLDIVANHIRRLNPSEEPSPSDR